MKRTIVNIFLYSLGVTGASFIVAFFLRTFVDPEVLHPKINPLQVQNFYLEKTKRIEDDLKIKMEALNTAKLNLEKVNEMFGGRIKDAPGVKIQMSLQQLDRVLEGEHHPSKEPTHKPTTGENKPDHPGHTEGHHDVSTGGTIILFAFSTLLIGSLLKEVKKKTNIPYTPMVLIAGGFLGYYSHRIPLIGHAINSVTQIDPHTLLMIFIPGLVFEGAYNTDGYTFNKSKWQVLMMAGPGVIVTSVLIAYTFVYLFGYGEVLSMSEALVIGSIISTTDPVAVVALLKDLGTSLKFNTLLEGESLLNDGTAFVFFLVCKDVVLNGSFDLYPSMIKFFRLSFGGPIFGILIGWISSRWIGSIMRDNTLIVVITVFFTYLVFFVSETYLEVSGILALVSLGVYLSQFTKVNLSHDNLHAVHTVWSFCGFVLETTIFFITGTFIGDLLTKLETIKLGGDDLLKGLLFIPVLNLIRYLVMLMQLPILNRIGFPISCTSALILSYGGLRGAIALSLAMLVFVDPHLNIDLRHLCLYYVVLTIAFTVCINGMTIKFLMSITGFLDVDPIKDKMKNNVLRKILISAFQFKDDILRRDQELQGADWDKVAHITHLSYYSILQEFPKLEEDYNIKKKEQQKDIDKSGLNMSIAPSMFAERVDQSGFHSPIKGPSNNKNLSRFAMKNMMKNKGILNRKSDPVIGGMGETARGLMQSERGSPDRDWQKKFASIENSIEPNHFKSMHHSKHKMVSSQSIDDEEKGDSSKQLGVKNTSPLQKSDLNTSNPFYKMRQLFRKSVNKIKKANRKKADGANIDIDARSQASEDIEKMIEDPFQNVAISQVKKELRDRVYMMIKHHIHDKQDRSLCRPDVVRSLKMLCDVCSDKIDQKICLREYAHNYLGKTLGYKLMKFFSKTPLFGQMFIKFIMEKVFFNYQFIYSLIKSATDVTESMDYMAHNIDYKVQVDEIKEEMMIDIMELVKVQESLHIQFSNLVGFIRTKMAAYRIIEHQRRLLKENEHQGLISEKDKDKLNEKLDKRINMINKLQPETLDIQVNRATVFQMSFPMFSSLTEEQIEKLFQQRSREEFKQQSLIFQQGDKTNFLYLVNDGIVMETFSAVRAYRKTKSGVCNIANICGYNGKNITTLNSVTDCKLYKIRKNVILELMEENFEFKETCYKLAFPELARRMEQKKLSYKKLLQGIDDSKLRKIGLTSNLKVFEHKQKFKLTHGGYLVKGDVSQLVKKKGKTQKLCYDSDTFVMPLDDYYTANKVSIMIVFTEQFMNKSKNNKSFKINHSNHGSSMNHNYLKPKSNGSLSKSNKSKNGDKSINIDNDKYLDQVFKQALRDGRLADPTPMNRQRKSIFKIGSKAISPNPIAERRFSRILVNAIENMKDSNESEHEKSSSESSFNREDLVSRIEVVKEPKKHFLKPEKKESQKFTNKNIKTKKSGFAKSNKIKNKDSRRQHKEDRYSSNSQSRNSSSSLSSKINKGMAVKPNSVSSSDKKQDLDHVPPRKPAYAKGFSSSGSGTDSSDDDQVVKSLDGDLHFKLNPIPLDDSSVAHKSPKPSHQQESDEEDKPDTPQLGKLQVKETDLFDKQISKFQKNKHKSGDNEKDTPSDRVQPAKNNISTGAKSKEIPGSVRSKKKKPTMPFLNQI